MNKLIIVVTLLTTFYTCVSAQNDVVKITASKSNHYGVDYFLPKTQIVIHLSYSKTIKKAGPYAKYAEKYLGLKSGVVFEDETEYAFGKLNLRTIGIPDKDNAYIVSFRPKTTAPFVCLTKDGILCSINADFIPETNKNSILQTQSEKAPKDNIAAQSAFSEDYFQAGSVGKMAEVAAKQIYTIRESRNDILTGQAGNMPKDGEAMKIVLSQLESQERALMQMFTGTVETEEKFSHDFIIDPRTDISNAVLFRFSKYAGVVDSDDLSGIPVVFNLKKSDFVPDLPPEERAKMDKDKKNKGIVYNIPGKGTVQIFYGDKVIDNETIDVTQFGTNYILGESMFENNKQAVKVTFYPETGGIRQINQ